ncbi:MAG TPA: ankyrin repeat domain-containing protein [Armatimonadota bacterium]|nr:ankyrin repeat domain-containing protein [Armatimonadota bacterium]
MLSMRPGLIQPIVGAILLIAVLAVYLCRFGSPRRWLVVALGVCLLDQATKALVMRHGWHYPTPSFFGGWLRIAYMKNMGLGFGGSSPSLLATTVGLVAALAVLYPRLVRRRYRVSVLTECGCALLGGGLLAILLDRVRLGYSVDFLEFGKSGDFAYNVADLAVFGAMALLAAGVLQFLWAARPRRLGLHDCVECGDGTALRAPPAGAQGRRQRGWMLLMLGGTAVLLATFWYLGRDEGARMPPLHRAASRGDAAAVARLLAKGADINAADKRGWSPLAYAACKSPEAVKLLLARGADANHRDKFGCTPLDWAVFKKDPQCLALLLAHGARMQSTAGGPSGLLLSAVTSRSPRTVALLLAHGADANATNGRGISAALRAAAVGARSEILELLLTAGADANAADRSGRTALHYAAECGNAASVRALLAAGAKVNTKDKDGATPLALAGAWCGPLARDASGHGASASETLSALVAAGADVSARSRDGWTALLRASVRRDAESVKLLIAAGADVNAGGLRGWTALHYASAKGDAETAKALLAAGADADAQNDDGMTPFHFARDRSVAALLRQHGARA